MGECKPFVAALPFIRQFSHREEIMDKYIAVLPGNFGAKNSGIVSRDRARQWAESQLTGTKATKVIVAEVVETVELSAPPVAIKPFHPPGVPTHGDRVEARHNGPLQQWEDGKNGWDASAGATREDV